MMVPAQDLTEGVCLQDNILAIQKPGQRPGSVCLLTGFYQRDLLLEKQSWQ